MSTSNLFVNAVRTTQGLFPRRLARKQARRSSMQKSGSRLSSTTVGSLLGAMDEIPSRTILLGQCEDSLPFLMALGDPEIGAILISCDAGFGKTHQLQVMADAAMRINAPHDLQISVLTLNPDEWDYLQSESKSQKYLHDIYAWYDNKGEQTIKTLTELAEDRRQGKQRGADVLLILDDVNYVEDLSYEAQVNLHWLLEYGSQSGVWVVATINAGLSEGFRYWINTFRTRILGRVVSSSDAEILAMRSDSLADSLAAGMFRVWAGDDWLTYGLVPLGD